MTTLTAEGVTIVSGLAMGVDRAVHEAALEASGGPGAHTVAVLAAGPEDGYPFTNKGVYERILSSGGPVLWEFPPDTPCSPSMFASRNRIIAGISQCVVVVESAEKGGSLITADLALQYDREVCAVPGSIFSKSSRGTNKLLREGATLVRDGRDVLQIMGMGKSDAKKGQDARQEYTIEKLQRAFRINKSGARSLFDEFHVRKIAVEDIQEMLRQSSGSVRSALTTLELEGILCLERDGTIKLQRKDL